MNTLTQQKEKIPFLVHHVCYLPLTAKSVIQYLLGDSVHQLAIRGKQMNKKISVEY